MLTTWLDATWNKPALNSQVYRQTGGAVGVWSVDGWTNTDCWKWTTSPLFFLFTKKNTRGDNRPLALAARGAQPSDKIRSRKDGPPSPKSAEGAGPVSSTGLTAQSGPPGRFDGSRTQ